MIRPMKPTDRHAVRALQGSLEYHDPDLVDAALDGPFLGSVATEGTSPVGYAIGFPGDPITLSELAVTPACRRRGHGRALVDAIASMGDGSIVVHTPAENQAAQQFYTAMGFERHEYRPGFYDDGSDALGFTRRE